MFSSNTSQVSSDATYIEDVFSTYLYTGNGSTQTITNGIDLAGKGGLVWMKCRNVAYGHELADTLRGTQNYLSSNTTAAANALAQSGVTAFNSNGFSVGTDSYTNNNGSLFASWTFRKQPKFSDVVTYTGNGAGARNIPHSLAAAPGCVIVKRTDSTGNWWVAHIGAELANGGNPASTSANFALNTTNPYAYSGAPYSVWAFGSNSATFYVNDQANISGATYVAYLFAHNAGGFGLTGTDNVISCGSYTGNGSTSGPAIDLGYEPQWILIKRASGGTGNWILVDTMRGLPIGLDAQLLYPNLSNAEGTNTIANLTATGFQLNTTFAAVNTSGSTYIYIAIRRGPMKTPTTGTSVYNATATTSSTNPQVNTTGFVADLGINAYRNNGGAASWWWGDRLRGKQLYLRSSATTAETNAGADVFNGESNTSWSSTLGASLSYVGWGFRRAPGFFDEVCYTGDGVGVGIKHNLGVPPELIIQKVRSANQGWNVYVPSSITGGGNTCQLNTTLAFFTSSNVTNVTSTQYDTAWASSGQTYVNYLFASCPGVSKVGSYTGNGSTQTINCGFTGGARFVLIKRTDSTGDWYVYDTARGMTTLTDPYLLLNSTAAEVTNTDYVDTYSAGFEISSTAPAAINANGGSFIFLAIA